MSARRHLAAVPTEDTAPGPRSYTLSIRDREVINEHMDWYERSGACESTRNDRRRVVERLAAELPCDLLAATPRMLDEWQSQLANRPRQGPRAGGKLSRGSLSTYTAHVRGFYRWAVQTDRTRTDLASRMPTVKQPPGQAHPIPEADLLAALAVAGEPVRSFLILAAFMGLRAGEIAGVRGESIAEVPGGRLVLSGLGKGRDGGKPFRMVVPRHVEPVLRPFVGRRGPVFATTTGRPVWPHWVTRTVSAFFRAQDMPYTCHWARHSYGTAVYQQTRDLLLTQDAMRHSSPVTTRIYVETTSDASVAAADELAERLLGGVS